MRGQVAWSSEHNSTKAPELFASANPDKICDAATWQETVDHLFSAAGQETGSAVWAATGRGCRASSESGSPAIEVRLEIIDPERVSEVTKARQDTHVANPPGLMGFEELQLDAAADTVSSSLLHRGLDRLEEHRWTITGDEADPVAYYLVVAVEPDGEAKRPDLLDATAKAMVSLDPLVARHHEAEPASGEDEVVDALAAVLATIVDQKPLDGLATAKGQEAIAFEYAFPENIVGIAAYRDDIVCEQEAVQAECHIEALDSTYRFSFVDDLGRWLLDDFTIDN